MVCILMRHHKVKLGFGNIRMGAETENVDGDFSSILLVIEK